MIQKILRCSSACPNAAKENKRKAASLRTPHAPPDWMQLPSQRGRYNNSVRYALFLAMTFPAAFAQSPRLTVDHVTTAGADLKQLEANLAAIGIRSEYGGPHSNHATQMALASFPDGSYLELIALQDTPDPQAVAAHYWSRY